MRNVWLVIKHEIRTTLRKRSFWLLTFLMPAVLLIFNTYYIFQENEIAGDETAEEEETDSSGPPTIGLVDEAGLIEEFPEVVPPGMFIRFPGESAALAALEASEIDQYVLIPTDFISSGEVTVYDDGFQILESGENMGVAFRGNEEWLLAFLINYNLTGDAALVNAFRNPTPGVLAEYHAVSPDEEDIGELTLANGETPITAQ